MRLSTSNDSLRFIRAGHLDTVNRRAISLNLIQTITTMNEETASSNQNARDYPDSIWRNWNFLRLLSGGFITNAGDSLYSVAILWFIFETSGSNFLTGLGSTLLLLPHMFGFIAGPIIDRYPLGRVLVLSQFFQGLVVLVLPIAAYTGVLNVALVLAVIPVLSFINLFSFPAQSTALPRIVSDDQLARSNSALQTVNLGLDMVFEALGGILIAVFGVTALFLADSGTFLVAAVVFLGMTIPAAKNADEDPEPIDVSGYIKDLKLGFNTLRGTVFVETILTSAVFNLAVGVTLAILPAFSQLRGGSALYGLMLGALGIGRLIGTASASYLEDIPFGLMTLVTSSISAVLWLSAVFSASRILTVGLFGIAWISAGVNGVMTTTFTQSLIPEDILGRVSSVKGAAASATLPIGSLVGGIIGDLFGILPTMAVAASGFGFIGVYYLFRTPLRSLPAVSQMEPSDFNLDGVR